MENPNRVLSLKEASDLLDHGMLLSALINNRKVFFYQREGSVVMQTNNMRTVIKNEDFQELFAKSEFEVFQESDDFIDPQKDEEYYSWRNK